MLTSDAALASLETNVWSLFSILGAGTGGSILDTPERLVVEAPLPQPPQYAVLRFRDDGTGPLAEQVAREWARFTRRGVNGVFLRHPTAPAAVDAALIANGLESTTEDYLRDVYSQGIGTHSRLFVARIDGRAVSKAVLHLSDGVAGIYGVATTERGRRYGQHRGLPLAAVRQLRTGSDRDRGCCRTSRSRRCHRAARTTFARRR